MGDRARPWIARAALAAAASVMLALVGAYLGSRWRGSGHVFVLAPRDGDVKIRFDDGEPVRVAAGEVIARQLPRGTHRVEVDHGGLAPLVHQVRIDHGGQRWVVPSTEDQCFLEVDVTTSAYGAGGEPSIARRRGATPFRVSGTTHLDRSRLPARRSEPQAVLLLHPVACDELALDDETLLARVPR
ncbi:MAG TPA: hypothetical protein VIL20_24795 [Sandaracinaceae bacterium]